VEFQKDWGKEGGAGSERARDARRAKRRLTVTEFVFVCDVYVRSKICASFLSDPLRTSDGIHTRSTVSYVY